MSARCCAPGSRRRERGGDVKPARMLLVLAGAVVLAAVLALLFVAYQQPEMLIDFTNMVFC